MSESECHDDSGFLEVLLKDLKQGMDAVDKPTCAYFLISYHTHALTHYFTLNGTIVSKINKMLY